MQNAVTECGLIYGGVPDPAQPAFLHRLVPRRAADPGKRWHVQQDRRAMILAAARGLMAERGFEHVCFRDIADLCGISIPTIYNTVGDRSRVMHDASAEWVEWMALDAAQGGQGAAALLRVLDTLWCSAVVHPRYTETAVRTFSSASHSLVPAFKDTGGTLVARLLQGLRARQVLRSSIAVDRLAWHLTQSVHAGVCNWSMHPYDAGRYRREFADGPGLMLLGAVCGDEIPLVERALEAIAGR